MANLFTLDHERVASVRPLHCVFRLARGALSVETYPLQRAQSLPPDVLSFACLVAGKCSPSDRLSGWPLISPDIAWG